MQFVVLTYWKVVLYQSSFLIMALDGGDWSPAPIR